MHNCLLIQLANNKNQPAIVSSSSLSLQSSVDSGDSRTRLQKYMEEELDTIRQAFQIRLSQMEKRYQRQLASVQQEAISRQQHSPQLQDQHQQPALQRRASWSGADRNNKRDLELPAPRMPGGASLKLDFESGSEESLNSCASANSSVCSSTVSTPGELRDHGSAQESLSQEELQAISQQIKVYKSQMMDAMMAEAEKKALQMEERYRQMRELAVHQGQNGVAHFTHLRGNGVTLNLNDQPETFV